MKYTNHLVTVTFIVIIFMQFNLRFVYPDESWPDVSHQTKSDSVLEFTEINSPTVSLEDSLNMRIVGRWPFSECRAVTVDEENGIIRVADIDAYDGTPIVDLKAYFPVCDRVKEAKIPEWLSNWPDWMPEQGIGLEE